nr:hypothetical protein [Tanacetum cinerariifolium]
TGRTTTLTTDDMQKKKNDVKARTTLLRSLPDEHQTWHLFLPQRTAAMKMATLTGKKISIQGSDVAGFDKSKVKCFNCHKVTSQESAEHPEVRKEEGKKAIDKGLKL